MVVDNTTMDNESLIVESQKHYIWHKMCFIRTQLQEMGKEREHDELLDTGVTGQTNPSGILGGDGTQQSQWKLIVGCDTDSSKNAIETQTSVNSGLGFT